MTTIAIAINNQNGYKLVTMADGDPEIVALTLKTNYNTPELVNRLLDKGNIITLGNSIEESSFTGEPAQLLNSVDIKESEITIMNKNFLYLNETWMLRGFGEGSYIIL
jgi:hypothetical protein